MTLKPQRKFGWKPDRPDYRDRYRVVKPTLLLPPSIDLLKADPFSVYDQGDLGSCTANAIAGAVEYDLIHNAELFFPPSRLFIYFNERDIEGTTDYDAGASIRDGIKTLYTLGVCDESLWPYDTTAFTQKPGDSCYLAALKNKAVKYERVFQSLASIKSVLATGYPIVFGFTVYESFMSPEVARTGIMSMPNGNESSVGGHAVLCVGYDDATQRFKVRNSWGDSWGDGGNFYMPYPYLLDGSLSDDLWVVESIS